MYLPNPHNKDTHPDQHKFYELEMQYSHWAKDFVRNTCITYRSQDGGCHTTMGDWMLPKYNKALELHGQEIEDLWRKIWNTIGSKE